MKYTWLRGLLLLAGTTLVACGQRGIELSEPQRQQIAASIDSATRAFESAQRARDAERIIAHLAPQFFMHADGQRLGHDEVAENIRRDFGSVREVEPGFGQIEVLVLDPNNGVASFLFDDSIIGADGEPRRMHGATTLVWSRLRTDWRIVYAHADHQARSH